MEIDKMTGSQALLNNDLGLNKPQIAAGGSTITSEHHKTEQTTTQTNGTYGTNLKQDVAEAVDKLNSFMEPVQRNLKFELHDKLGKYYVSVIDSTTSEVIKEIPPKKMLDMYAAMAEFMGILIDEKI